MLFSFVLDLGFCTLNLTRVAYLFASFLVPVFALPWWPCCCTPLECGACDSETAANEYQVDIADVIDTGFGDCDCDDLNGTWVLSYLCDITTSCAWFDEAIAVSPCWNTDYFTESSCSGGSQNVTCPALRLILIPSGFTSTTIVQLSFLYDCSSGSSSRQAVFESVESGTSIDCAFVDLVLDGVTNTQDCDVTTTPATATLNAL